MEGKLLISVNSRMMDGGLFSAHVWRVPQIASEGQLRKKVNRIRAEMSLGIKEMVSSGTRGKS